MNRKTRKTFDLNKPNEARDYLTNLEEAGMFELDWNDSVALLTDEEVLAAARIAFMQLHSEEVGSMRGDH